MPAPVELAPLLAKLRAITATLERDRVIERGLEAAVELLGVEAASLDLGAGAGVVRARREGEAIVFERDATADWLGGSRAPLEREGASLGELRVAAEVPAALLEAIAAQLVVGLANAAEHARLRADEARVWSILDNSNSSVFIKDLEGRYVLVNRQLEIDTGLSRDQVLGRTDAELFDEATARRILADDRRVFDSGELAEFEGVTQFPSGPRVFLTTKFPLRDGEGRVYALCGISKDISARRQAEHSHRLDALGQLAGGIAHDFNNMLAAMLGGAELISLGLDDLDGDLDADAASELREAVAMIMTTGERAAELTRELLAFSREGHREAENVDVHAVIRSTVTLLRRSLERRVSIELDLGARQFTVRGSETRLQAALLHLGVNACDAMAGGGAMGGGGRLTITTRDVALGAQACAAVPFMIQPGDFVEITVRDTGSGIDEQTLARIFEPFYSTKAVGRGTGLGLVAVRSTVVEHGGAIEIRSEVGVGTEVIVRLPVVATPIAETLVAVPSPIHYSPSGSLVLDDHKPMILIVDDEPIVRKTGRLVLEALGYAVVVAEDGQDGVDRFREHAGRVDLVLLDMIMPRLDGEEAFVAMREIDASVPIVVCSGYAEGEAVERLRAQGLAGFLAKPFRRQQLIDAIEQALAGAREP